MNLPTQSVSSEAFLLNSSVNKAGLSEVQKEFIAPRKESAFSLREPTDSPMNVVWDDVILLQVTELYRKQIITSSVQLLYVLLDFIPE